MHKFGPGPQHSCRGPGPLLSRIQQSGDGGTANIHGALGAELLTAEAADAAAPIDVRSFVLHRDSFGRADVSAQAAAHTVSPTQGGALGQQPPEQFSPEPLDYTGSIPLEKEIKRIPAPVPHFCWNNPNKAQWSHRVSFYLLVPLPILKMEK